MEVQNVCKVGLTKNVVRRVGSIQSAHWMNIHIVAAFELDNLAIAAALEKAILLGYSKYRIRGEWFSISPVIMTEAIREGILNIGLTATNLVRAPSPSDWGLKLIKSDRGAA